MKVSFRPHHFLCTLAFEGMGYSPAFVKAYTTIADALKGNEDIPITVQKQADSICAACPHKRGISCKDAPKIQALDNRHAEILGLEDGMTLTWKDAKKRIRENITLSAFHEICAGCSWKALGVCEKALKALQGHDEEAHA